MGCLVLTNIFAETKKNAFFFTFTNLLMRQMENISCKSHARRDKNDKSQRIIKMDGQRTKKKQYSK